MSEIPAGDLYAGIERSRRLAEHRRYGEALSVIEDMATEYRQDGWLQDLAKEANALFVTAEGLVSEAERLEREDRPEDAYAKYVEATRAYDHHPGLWPLVFYFLPGWLLAILMTKEGKTGPEAQALEDLAERVTKLRDESMEQMRRRDHRMTLESRIGWMTVTMDEPWPGVVKAFCNSRPAARVNVHHPNQPPTSTLNRLGRAIADAIRSHRHASESWDVSLHREPKAGLSLRLVGPRGRDETLVVKQLPLEEVDRVIIAFSDERWPTPSA